jgi:hypothetical protein
LPAIGKNVKLLRPRPELAPSALSVTNRPTTNAKEGNPQAAPSESLGVTAEQGSNPRLGAVLISNMKQPDKMLVRVPMREGNGSLTFRMGQLNQMPDNRLAALRKLVKRQWQK